MDKKYKKMLKFMAEKEKSAGKKRSRGKWFLYILKCTDGSFYTGITNNMDRRFKMHNSGKASRYTRTRLPVELLYQETLKSRTQALIRECAVKAMPKQRKLKLIECKISGGVLSCRKKKKETKPITSSI